MRLLIFVFLSSDPFHLSPPFEYNERLDQTYVYIQKSCFLLLIELYVSYLKYFDNFKKLHARIFVQNYRIYQYPPLSSFIVNYLVNCIKMSKIFVRFLFVTNNFSLMSSHKYKDTIEKIPLKNTSSLVKTKKHDISQATIIRRSVQVFIKYYDSIGDPVLSRHSTCLAVFIVLLKRSSTTTTTLEIFMIADY